MEVEAADFRPKAPLEKNHLKKSTLLELEAVLRVSSHLQQIMYDLSKCLEGSAVPPSEGKCTSRGSGKKSDAVKNGQARPNSSAVDLSLVPDSGVALLGSEEVVEESICILDHNTEAVMRSGIKIWSLDQYSFSLDQDGVEKSMEQIENFNDGSLSSWERLPSLTSHSLFRM
ncbi:hypothetical protein R1flu_019389 [Riccia fluitans]|uniref:Uncharacterized protein n=1 Tax=Riccia fluitans TaxID=41844 RepID=A0ABD1ZKP9_9MARC